MFVVTVISNQALAASSERWRVGRGWRVKRGKEEEERGEGGREGIIEFGRQKFPLYIYIYCALAVPQCTSVVVPIWQAV